MTKEERQEMLEEKLEKLEQKKEKSNVLKRKTKVIGQIMVDSMHEQSEHGTALKVGMVLGIAAGIKRKSVMSGVVTGKVIAGSIIVSSVVWDLAVNLKKIMDA